MNRSLNSLTVSLLGILLVAGYATAATVIDFSSAEGYTNGVLNNQPGTSGTWKTSTGASYAEFQVNTSDGGSVALSTTANSKIAGYSEQVSFLSSGPVTMSMEFQFTQSSSTAAGATSAFGLGFSTGQSTALRGTSAVYLGRSAGTDSYRMAAFSFASLLVTGAQIGLDSASSDTLSDVIRLTITLNAVNSTTWSGTATLYNVTTGTQIITYTKNDISAGDLSTSLYGGMLIGGSMATSGLSSVSVFNYTTTVPEPGTYVLLGLALCAMTVYVRRRKVLISR
ncbi:MAG: PEP-CTERM sorting domain-containing protein [Verrucomicrobia bacterium]|nr:PEP-CTERM sorting domain-containing protein [Verrucomicrobiota bacterium]